MEEVAQVAINGFIVFACMISYGFISFIFYMTAIANSYKHVFLCSVFWIVYFPYMVIMELTNNGDKLIDIDEGIY